MSYNDYKYNEGDAYPLNVPERYVVRLGQYGMYFHDRRSEQDMPLNEIRNTLESYALRKAQLAWMIGKYGEPK